MSNILQFPNRRKTVFGPTGRLGREVPANPFNADDRSRIILQAIFGERM